MAQLSPYVQIKYHEQLMGTLSGLMVSEEQLKMQTQATRAVLAFCEGLLSFDEEDEEATSQSGRQLMELYAQQLL